MLWVLRIHAILIILQVLPTSLAQCPACWCGCDCRQPSSLTAVCFLTPFVLQYSQLFCTIHFLFALLPIPSLLHFARVLSLGFSFSISKLLCTKIAQLLHFSVFLTLCCVMLFLRLGLIIYVSNIFLHLCVSLHFKYLSISFSLDMRAHSSLCTPLLSQISL